MLTNLSGDNCPTHHKVAPPVVALYCLTKQSRQTPQEMPKP